MHVVQDQSGRVDVPCCVSASSFWGNNWQSRVCVCACAPAVHSGEHSECSKPSAERTSAPEAPPTPLRQDSRHKMFCHASQTFSQSEILRTRPVVEHTLKRQDERHEVGDFCVMRASPEGVTHS